jgi:hypothetical protein
MRVIRIVNVREPGFSKGSWVGLGPLTQEQREQGDTTLPEVTHRYWRRATLEAAIADGSAFLGSGGNRV